MDSISKINDQKGCKCKKSKCLKLYCDCFAAGLYCDECCACQECFNRLDYKDTVNVTRRQIELRNPLAFSSKIHCFIQSPEDENQPKPIVGKHRNGCNCKKSMCLKKYCECYQANVGCCDECQCEGCQNAYGKKVPEYNEYNKSIHESVKKETKSTGSGFSVPAPNNPPNLTSWTPFQYSGHGNNTTTTGTYIPSTGSANHDMMLDTSRGVFAMTPLNQQSYPDVEFMNQFTPPLMDCPNSSRAYGDFCSLGSSTWPGSLVNPVSVFGGPKVNNFNKNPVYNVDENTPNTLIYPSLQYRQRDFTR